MFEKIAKAMRDRIFTRLQSIDNREVSGVIMSIQFEGAFPYWNITLGDSGKQETICIKAS
jgi:hypothetical protein